MAAPSERVAAALKEMREGATGVLLGLILVGVKDVRSLEGSRLRDRLMTSTQPDVDARHLADALKTNSTLQRLCLGFYRIGDEGARHLADALKTNSMLQILDLPGNDLGAEGAQHLADELKMNSTLHELVLNLNYIGDEGARHLATALKTSSTLQRLNLAGSIIGAEGARYLADALKTNSALQMLNLDNNSIGAEGARHLADALKTNSTLQALVLGYNDIGGEGARHLAAALKTNSSLQTLHLSSNIGAEGARHLADALKTNSTLQELHLDRNSIGDEGARHLADALKTNSTLQELHLDTNSIGADGVRHLADALKTNSTLQELNLKNNSIGAEGARHLADALKTNSTLQTLDLDTNSIGADGVRHLADALKTNSALQTLNLWENSLGDEGARHLADALKTNSTLQTLDLRSNSIGAESARALLDGLQANEALRELGLDSRGISAEVVAQLEARVKVVKEQVDDFGRAAKSAMVDNVKVRWARAKLMLLGRGAAGKTSLVRSLVTKEPVLTHESTQGAELTQTRTRDWVERRADESDLPEHMAKHVYGGGTGDAEDARSELRQPRDHSTEVVPVPAVEQKDLARAYSAQLKAYVQSQGSRINVEMSFTIWDYGGQEVFYTLHHLFLTQFGVYVVVFDMRELLDDKARFKACKDHATLASRDEALATLRFWLDSIKLHAPEAEVLLVGTRLDFIEDADLTVINNVLDNGLQLMRNSQIAGAGDLWFYIVNNMDREDMGNVERIKAAVVKAVCDKDFVTQKVPLRWTLAMDRLLADSRSYWALADVEKLALEECGVDSEETRQGMLPFLHELGVIVHFGKSFSAALRSLVVTRPQWLLDSLARVICEPRHMQARMMKLRQEVPVSLRDDVAAWRSEALASTDLLDWLWQDRDVEYLTDLMEEMLLASAVNTVRTTFLVPSLLQYADTVAVGGEEARMADGVLCWLAFDLLPKGFFQRMICSCAREEGFEYTSMHANLAVVIVRRTKVLLVADHDARRVDVRFAAEDSARVYDIVKLMYDIFHDVNEAFMKGRLGTRLVLSADGSHDASACVNYAEFLEAVDDAPSLQPGEFVTLAALGAFAKPPRGATLERAASTITSRGYNVFVSYCHESPEHIARVADLVRGLRAAGLHVWWDQDCIGADAQTGMANGIRDSRVFVVVVTRAYADKVNLADRNNLHKEFSEGVNKRPVQAVVMDASMLTSPSEWPGGVFTFKLGDPVYVDMVENLAQLPRLVEAIRKHT